MTTKANTPKTTTKDIENAPAPKHVPAPMTGKGHVIVVGKPAKN